MDILTKFGKPHEGPAKIHNNYGNRYKHITDTTLAYIGSLDPPLSTIGHAFHSPALYWEKENALKL